MASCSMRSCWRLNCSTRLATDSGVAATRNDDEAAACAVGGVAELLDDFLSQPAIKIVAAITPVMIAFFIKRIAAER